MKIFNKIFYLILFISFVLPTNSSFHFQVFGISLYIREIGFILLPIINLCCASKGSIKINNKKLKSLILVFFIAVALSLLLKVLLYNETISGIFKSWRIGLPLFSTLFLLYQGIKSDIKIVWTTLLYATSVSVLLSVLSFFIYIPIYPGIESGADLLAIYQGRLYNANNSFAIIGMYLLFDGRDKWYNKGLLPKVTSVLSIISLLLGFNRTYLFLLVAELSYLLFIKLSYRTLVKSFAIAGVVFISLFLVYNNVQMIKNQVDKRILSIVLGVTTLQESTIENNRDIIYEGIIKRIKEGYWLVGLPNNLDIFSKKSRQESASIEVYQNTTDTSFANILLTNGVLALLIFFFILWRVGKIRLVPLLVLFIYILASLNIDSLYKHNSIFFLFIYGFVYYNNMGSYNQYLKNKKIN